MFKQELIRPVAKLLAIATLIGGLAYKIDANEPKVHSDASVVLKCTDTSSVLGTMIFNDPNINPINPLSRAFKKHSAMIIAMCVDPVNSEPKGKITVTKISSTDACKAPTGEEIFDPTRYCVDVNLMSPQGGERPKLVYQPSEDGSRDSAVIVAEGAVITGTPS